MSLLLWSKAFSRIFPMGGWGWVLKRTKNYYSWFSTAGHPVVHYCGLYCFDLLWTGVGLSSILSSSFSFLLDFKLLVESSSDVFLFLSCQYCLPPFLCSFFPDIAHCILLLDMLYFVAISVWDFLLTMQSLTAIKSNVDCSPMLLIMLCSFSSTFYPYTFGSHSSCTWLGSSS